VTGRKFAEVEVGFRVGIDADGNKNGVVIEEETKKKKTKKKIMWS
jgi:hypothetical protein